MVITNIFSHALILITQPHESSTVYKAAKKFIRKKESKYLRLGVNPTNICFSLFPIIAFKVESVYEEKKFGTIDTRIIADYRTCSSKG
jgi:hypothetical protein